MEKNWINWIHLVTGTEENSSVFPRILMFPETKSRKTSILEGNKTKLNAIQKTSN